MKTRFFDPPLPRLIAHRGFSGRYPENTLTAFRAAVEAGLYYLEFDVWLSRDRHLVVHHDLTCQRTCGDSRRVTELTLAELKSLDAGRNFSTDGGSTYPFRDQGITIPTLEEVLTAFPEAFFTIEIKADAPDVESILFDILRACGKEDAVLIGSEVDEVLSKIRGHSLGIPTGCSRSEAVSFLLALKNGTVPESPSAEVLHLPMFHCDIPLISRPLVEAARAKGLEVHVWTVNKAQDMEDFLAQGVAGITTDFPDLLLEVAGKFQ